MRRNDRKMDKEFGFYVIDNSEFGSLAVFDKDKNEVYNLPLSIVRDGNTLYFHSAKSGRKTEIFSQNPSVSISFVTDLKIPENYSPDELEEIANDKSKSITLISRVFTTEFASTIVNGDIMKIEEEDEKIHALKLICQKWTPNKMKYFPIAIEAGLDKVNIYAIKINDISSKRKKYDSRGEEMKWGRME